MCLSFMQVVLVSSAFPIQFIGTLLTASLHAYSQGELMEKWRIRIRYLDDEKKKNDSQ